MMVAGGNVSDHVHVGFRGILLCVCLEQSRPVERASRLKWSTVGRRVRGRQRSLGAAPIRDGRFQPTDA